MQIINVNTHSKYWKEFANSVRRCARNEVIDPKRWSCWCQRLWSCARQPWQRLNEKRLYLFKWVSKIFICSQDKNTNTYKACWKQVAVEHFPQQMGGAWEKLPTAEKIYTSVVQRVWLLHALLCLHDVYCQMKVKTHHLPTLALPALKESALTTLAATKRDVVMCVRNVAST